MLRFALCTLLLSTTLAGCTAESSTDAPADPSADAGAADASADTLSALRAGITELYARAEHDAAQVEVQHLLVSFAGVRGMRGVKRNKQEAEQLAADLMARIAAGEDFDALVKEHTNDSHPGIYPMTTSSRRGMVAAFGDVAWRLEVGEFGVAPFHQQDSPYGWHIIQRRK